MMNTEVRLDPDSLRQRGARLIELGIRVGQTYTDLKNCLTRSEGGWGDDDLGVAFAEQFEPHADRLLADVQAMADSLRATASGIVTAAGEFENQDAQVGRRVRTTAGDDTGSSIQQPGLWAIDRPASTLSSLPPATPGLAAPSTAIEPVPASDRGQHTERSTPATRLGPEISTARSAPQHAAAPPADSPGRTDPWADPASRNAAGTPAAPGNRSRSVSAPAGPAAPPPTPVSPLSAPSNAARPPGAVVAPRTATDAVHRDTPWSGQQQKTVPGSPTGAQANPTTPPHGGPPRPNKQPTAPERKADRRGSGNRPGADPALVRLARSVAERHGVQVSGFDIPGLRVPVVREFVAAVDRVLTDYPMIDLDVVEVAELPAGSDTVQWSARARGSGEAARTITLDYRTARQPGHALAAAESDAAPGIYPATLRAFGSALDHAGSGIARRQAQRMLLVEYLSREPARHRSLADVVRGYKSWRAELTGDGAGTGEFDLSRAFGAAFCDVVQRGDEATIQARTLHAVLVAASTRRE